MYYVDATGKQRPIRGTSGLENLNRHLNESVPGIRMGAKGMHQSLVNFQFRQVVRAGQGFVRPRLQRWGCAAAPLPTNCACLPRCWRDRYTVTRRPDTRSTDFIRHTSDDHQLMFTINQQAAAVGVPADRLPYKGITQPKRGPHH